MRITSSLPVALSCLIMVMLSHSATAAAEAPARGMTMDQVTQAYGRPLEIKAPVGDPPITRWVYQGYTVYFDHNYVIHSVMSRDATQATNETAGSGDARPAPVGEAESTR